MLDDKSVFETAAKGNIYIVQYILIWLSYVLSLIKNEEKGSLNEFYKKYIEKGDNYNNNIDYIVGYKCYKDIIDKNNYILSMDKSIISKLYDAFNTLCDTYIEFDTNNSDCKQDSEKAHQFVEKYKKIIIDHNIGENIRYFHCELITAADINFVDDPNRPREDTSTGLFNSYCPYNKCDTDDKIVSSTFIALLKYFEWIDDENLDSDKLVEYAILWLSYRLNQKKESGTTKIYNFYTNNVETNNKYEENISTNNKIKKDVICKKIKSIDIDIKDISNFYDAFKSLCN
ncbi:hypothetical protein YYC_03877, partial [Plasmodium yoelii 17X]